MMASLPQPADLAQERQWSVTERGQMATALAARIAGMQYRCC